MDPARPEKAVKDFQGFELIRDNVKIIGAVKAAGFARLRC